LQKFKPPWRRSPAQTRWRSACAAAAAVTNAISGRCYGGNQGSSSSRGGGTQKGSSHAIDLPCHFVYETHAVLQREKEAAAAAKEAKKKKKSK
jgi:hypothetical protein